MATLLDINFDAGTEGTTCTTGNTANGSFAFTAIESNGTFAAAAAHHGPFGIQGPAAGTTNYARFGVSGNTYGFRFAFHLASMPGADATLMRFTDSAGSTTYMTLEVSSTGYLRIRASGSVVWTAAAALSANTWYVVRGAIDAGSSTSTGKVTIAYSSGWSQTAIDGPTETTGLNFGGSGVIGRFQVLKNTSSSPAIRNDGVYLTDTYTVPGYYSPAPAASTKVIGGPLANAGGWSVIGSGVYTDEQALGDASASTGIQSPGATTNETRIVRLAPTTTAGTLSWEVDMAVGAGSVNTSGKVEVLQGLGASPTVIATRMFTGLTTTPTTKTVTLTSGEKAAITDASQLAMRFTGNPA